MRCAVVAPWSSYVSTSVVAWVPWVEWEIAGCAVASVTSSRGAACWVCYEWAVAEEWAVVAVCASTSSSGWSWSSGSWSSWSWVAGVAPWRWVA